MMSIDRHQLHDNTATY